MSLDDKKSGILVEQQTIYNVSTVVLFEKMKFYLVFHKFFSFRFRLDL
jgi:hypothetical protein